MQYRKNNTNENNDALKIERLLRALSNEKFQGGRSLEALRRAIGEEESETGRAATRALLLRIEGEDYMARQVKTRDGLPETWGLRDVD